MRSLPPVPRSAVRRSRWSLLLGCVVAVLTPVADAGSAVAAATPPTSGTISVEIDSAEPNLDSAVFLDAVGKALAAHGFTVLEGAGHGRFVATLKLSRSEVGTTTKSIPVDRSLLSGGGVGVGASFSLALPTAKTRSVPLQQTGLEIRIHARDEAAVLWRGAAVTVRGADAGRGQDAAVASDLIETVLRIYPQQSEDVASVP